MNKKWMEIFNGSIKRKILIVFICSLFISIFLFSFRNTLNKHIINAGNKFTIHIVNFGFPVASEINKQNDVYLSDDISIKESLQDLLGLNKNNLGSTLIKEISYLRTTDSNLEFQQLEPYTLTADAISKQEIAANETNKSDIAAENIAPQGAAINNLPNTNKNVYSEGLKLKELGQTPRVFIYSTHTCESYAPGPNNTTDQSKNVCAVGDELEKELEKNYNIYTIHDKTIHDVYGYIDSYARSGVTLSKYLKQYGDFDLIIDMHRDSITDKRVVTSKFNEESTANVRFVMTKWNPHFNKNMAVADSLQSIANKLFPGFCRDPLFYNKGYDFYSQDKSNNAVLIEVGSIANTTTEAKASAKYLARVFAEYLHKKYTSK